MAFRTSSAVGVDNDTTITSNPMTTVIGDYMVMVAFSYQGQALILPTDSYGNLWTQLSGSPFNYTASGTAFQAVAYGAPLTSAGTGHTVTVTCSNGAAALTQYVSVFSGRAGTLDGSAANPYIDTDFFQAHTGLAITTSNAGSDVLCVISNGGNPGPETFATGTGFTSGAQFNGTGGIASAGFIEYQAGVAAGTYTGAWTTGAFVEGVEIVYALNAASSSGTLSAFSGTYSVAGKAASLGSVLNLNALAGSYSVAGKTVGVFPVSTQLLLLANSGSYNYIGAPAFDDFQISLGVGIYSVRGGIVNFPTISSFFLSLNAGLYLETGETAMFATVAPPFFLLMPNLVGLNYYEALLVLEQLGIYVPLSVLAFEPSTINVAWQKSTATPGTVIIQSIPAGTSAVPNEKMTLTLAQFPFSSSIDMPPDDKQVN